MNTTLEHLRHKAFSYSSLATLHSCPRKSQLQKQYEDADAVRYASVDTAFGHVVGTGIQALLAGATLNQARLQGFLAWSMADLAANKPTAKKSIVTAMDLITAFHRDELADILEDWEIFMLNGKPCNELGFGLGLPDGFMYVGFLDTVLQNRKTKELACIELKTTGSYAVDEASYLNQSQTTGYAVALDVLCRNLSLPPTIHVFYIIVSSATGKFTTFNTSKSSLDRVELINDLAASVALHKFYEENYLDVYPKRGASCMAFGRRCEYYGNCHLPFKLDKTLRVSYKNIQIRIDYEGLKSLQTELALK